MSNDIPTKEIGEMLDTVSEKIPKLIKGLMDTLFSAEAGKSMGQAVGNLYNELIAAGIPSEEALKMARDYLISLKDIQSSITQSMNNNN